jgi:hypothetical protein
LGSKQGGMVHKRNFSIVRVILDTLRVYYQNAIAFTLISAVNVIAIYGIWQLDPSGLWPRIFDVVFGSLITAIILIAAYRHICGLPVSFAEVTAQAVSLYPTYLAVNIVFIVVNTPFYVMDGLPDSRINPVWAFLVIISTVLTAIWYVVDSVCLVEKAGLRQCFKRSSALSKGLRWRFFGLYLIELLLGYSYELIRDTSLIGDWWHGGVYIVWFSIYGAFSASIGAVAYYYVEAEKSAEERIAAVFD